MKWHYLNPCFWSYCLWKRRYNRWSAKRNLQMHEDIKIVGEYNRLHPEDLRVYMPRMPFVVISAGSNSRWLAKAAEVKINGKYLKELVQEELRLGSKSVRVLPQEVLVGDGESKGVTRWKFLK